MRNYFHEELDHITGQLVELCSMAATAMRSATTALLENDKELASQVIRQDKDIDNIYRQVEDQAHELLAMQQPVAVDLRIIVTSLRMVAEIERMGDLAEHIAQTVVHSNPESAIPEQQQIIFGSMGDLAYRLAIKVGQSIAERDADKAAELEHDDDEMDTLHRRLVSTILHGWEHSVESAIDTALLARYYERFADHCVTVSRRVMYIVTGEMP